MAFEPMIFKDRAVKTPNAFELEDGQGNRSAVTLIRTPGEVYEEGTPLSAKAMNRLSNGVYAARETFVEDMAPDSAKNQSKGVVAGDRCLRAKQYYQNVIPPDWEDVSKWVDVSTDYNKKYAFGTGSSAQGIRGIQLISKYNPDSTTKFKYSLTGFTLPRLVEGHKYFFGATVALPAVNPPFLQSGSSASIQLILGSKAAMTLTYSASYLLGGGNLVSSNGGVLTADGAETTGVTIEINTTLLTPLIQNVAMWVEGLMLIDLTKHCGKGEELTRVQCLELFSAPVSSTTANDRERYFEGSHKGRSRYFVCNHSEPDMADWRELPMLSDLSTYEIAALSGFTFAETNLPRYFRFGPFVYFEATVTVTTAISVIGTKDMMLGLPTPNHTVKIPVRTAASSTNAFFLFDPALDASIAKLQSTTTVAINEVLRFSGIYLAKDMGNA